MADTEPKILIVEQDEKFSAILVEDLEAQGYSVVSVPNGNSALANIGVQAYAVVLLEVRLPDMNGIQLLHKIKAMRPVHVILMSAAPEFKNPQDSLEVGAVGFLMKPFQSAVLLDMLSKCLGGKTPKPKPSGPSAVDEGFCKIDINDFFSGSELHYDIYVRLSDQKYLKIAKRGDSFSADRIQSYKEKDVTYFYMRLEEFRRYVGISVNMTQVVKDSPALSKGKKFQFMANVSNIILTQLRLEGVNDESFAYSKAVLETTLSLMADSSDLVSVLEVLRAQPNALFAHSLAVSLHSSMIGRAMGWTSSIGLFRLSMGGLLHDIGKKDIPDEILYKPSRDLTPKEQKILESHAELGGQILSKFPSIPSEVVQVAAHHHENCLGTGYPQALKAGYIHPLAKVVAVANEFCNLVIKGPDNPKALSPEQAIRKMAMAMTKAMDFDAFEGLAKVFKIKLMESENRR